MRQDWWRCVAGLLLLCALAMGTTRCVVRYEKYELAHYLPRVKVPDQVDCGSVKVPMAYPFEIDSASLPSITQCVNAALQDHQAFFFLVEGPGIDSYMATGLVGDAQGYVRRFWYDSAPCGGPHCPEGFSAWPCEPVPAGVQLDPNKHCPRPERVTSGRTRS